MKKVLFGLLLVLGQMASAKSLSCFETGSFLPGQFTISRDGEMGFVGTLISVEGLNLTPLKRTTLADITGRPEDQEFPLTGLKLDLAPLGICTNPNGAPMDSFKCSGLVSIEVTGESLRNQGGDIADRLVQSSQLKAQVDVELSTGNIMILKSTIKGRGKDVVIQVPIRDPQHTCKIVQQ